MISRVNELAKLIKRESKKLTSTDESRISVEVFDPFHVPDIPPFSATQVYSDESTGFTLHVGGVSVAMYKTHLQNHRVKAILNCAAAQTASTRRIIQASGNSLEGSGWDKVEFSQAWYACELDDPSFMYLAISAEDHSKFPLSDYFKDTSLFIQEARMRGYPILIHCMQGMNRSVAVTVAWMVSHGGHTLDSAIQHISSLRPHILSNRGFIKQLVTAFEPKDAVPVPITPSNFVVKDIIERI